MQKQYFVYITTNLINNKQYIGYHYGDINDNYLGSGTYILKAIKKYGKQNFKREILEICPDKETVLKQEQYWIMKFNAVKDNNFYNFSAGGEKDAGWENYRKWAKLHPEEVKKISEKNIQRLKEWRRTHPEEVQHSIQLLIESAKKWRETHPEEVNETMKKVNKAKEDWQQAHPEEHQKQIDKWREAGSIANSVPVRCITTGEIFPSISAAARAYKEYGCQQTNLSKVLKGERKSCGKKNGQKLLWEFIKKD